MIVVTIVLCIINSFPFKFRIMMHSACNPSPMHSCQSIISGLEDLRNSIHFNSVNIKNVAGLKRFPSIRGPNSCLHSSTNQIFTVEKFYLLLSLNSVNNKCKNNFSCNVNQQLSRGRDIVTITIVL